MKKLSFALLGTVILMLSILNLVACKKDNLAPDNEDQLAGLNAIIDSTKAEIFDSISNMLGDIVMPDEIYPPIVIDEITENFNDSIVCTTKVIEVAPGRDEAILMGNSNRITPGAVFTAGSIEDGSYKQIITPMNPICATLSFTTMDGSPKDIIVDPTQYSSAQETIQRLLKRGLEANAPTKISIQVEEIFTTDQFNVAFGAHYDGTGFDISSSFDFNNSNSKKTVVAKMSSHFASIAIDKKPFYKYFSTIPDPQLFGGKHPIIVDRIDFGMISMVVMEFENSDTQLNAMIESSFNAFAGSGGINANTHLKDIFEKTTVKIIQLGGAGGHATHVNSPKDLEDYFSSIANFSEHALPVAIGYSLSNMVDGTTLEIVMNTEYPVRDCEVIPATYFEFNPEDSYVLLPNHQSGDADFGVNSEDDLRIDYEFELFVEDSSEIWLNAYAKWQETNPDYTGGVGEEAYKIFEAPEGFKINAILSDAKHQGFYYYDDKSIDIFEMEEDDLINCISSNGDTNGDDVPGIGIGEDRSWMEVKLNTIKLELKKIL